MAKKCATEYKAQHKDNVRLNALLREAGEAGQEFMKDNDELREAGLQLTEDNKALCEENTKLKWENLGQKRAYLNTVKELKRDLTEMQMTKFQVAVRDAGIEFNGPVQRFVAGVVVGLVISAATKIQAAFRGFLARNSNGTDSDDDGYDTAVSDED